MDEKKYEALISSMNEEQLQAVGAGDGAFALLGGPGSGKTRCVVGRIARLIHDDYPPENILAMTFTRAAAWEMNNRLEDLGIKGCRVGTIHSVCRQIVAAETDLMKIYRVDERNQLLYEVRKMLWDYNRDRSFPRRGVDRGGIERFLSACKATGVVHIEGDPFDLNYLATEDIAVTAKRWIQESGLTQQWLVRVYEEMERRRTTRGLCDFDDMLSWCWHLLISSPDVRQRWGRRWGVVIIDEAQDNVPVQWDVGVLLTGRPSVIKPELAGDCDWKTSLMMVGDVAQCHPPGTLVTVEGTHITSRTRHSRIESLRTGHTVSGWSRHSQSLRSGKKVKVGARQYDGPLVHVQAGDRETRVTPNHRLLCRWTSHTTKLHVTYLMYRVGYGFRVGWCQLFRGKGGRGAFHLGIRARHEKADRTWILKAGDRDETSRYEAIVAGAYGLPQVTYEPPDGATLRNAAALREIWDGVTKTRPAGLKSHRERGYRCLADHGLLYELPMLPWPPGPDGKQPGTGRKTLFPVYASNIIPDVMSVPMAEKGRWEPVTGVPRTMYEGMVHSLDVAGDHMYAADGIVVMNSVYGFRHADPHIFLDYIHKEEVSVFRLPRNYRAGKLLCNAATSFAKGQEWNPLGDIISHRGEEGELKVQAYASPAIEAEEVVARCMEIAETEGYGACAVLARLNVSLDLIEIACVRNRVPYIRSSGNSFTSSSEARDVLGYLRVAGGWDTDGKHLRRIINRPFRYFSKKLLTEAEGVATSQNLSLIDAMMTLQSRMSYGQVRELNKLYDLLRELARQISEATAGPAMLIGQVLDKTDYIEYIRRNDGLLDLDESKLACLGQLQHVAREFVSTRDFIVYIDALTVALEQAQRTGLRKRQAKDAVTLSTVHAAKGLEFKNVFIVDVVQGRFPCTKSKDHGEEDRLFYVALTRAEDCCTVSYTTPASDEVLSVYVRRITQHLGTLPNVINDEEDKEDKEDSAEPEGLHALSN